MKTELPAAADNLTFLVAEVRGQVVNLRNYLATRSPALARRVLDRRGYAENLKRRIHESCLSKFRRRKGPVAGAYRLRALETTATELERIATLCRQCTEQVGLVEKRRYLRSTSLQGVLVTVEKGLGLIEPAIAGHDIRIALKLGQLKSRLTRANGKIGRYHSRKLRRGKHPHQGVPALFAVHAIEQMGDALMNIGDAIISAHMGRPFKVERLDSLKTSVQSLGDEVDADSLTVETVAETRSGHGVSGIGSGEAGQQGYVAIFKDGQRSKLKEERARVEDWHEIYPGLAPKILSYHRQGESAAMLIEHLAGLTFDQVLLHESNDTLAVCLEQLKKTLSSVWRETRLKKPATAKHMRQLSKRLPDVYAIHPEFSSGGNAICTVDVAAMENLVQAAAKMETKLAAPFSVYIHGDFNIDNIIYDPARQRINFIDLHRSRYMDYVQDVSVFMVSNYRLQIMDKSIRRRILDVAYDMYLFAANHARRVDDKGFELRLALGLARSFATSTRFILDKSMARGMILRSRYILERVTELRPKARAAYRLPVRELFSV